MNASDRCDQCGAQAQALMIKESAELMLCGHHFRRHETAMTRDGWALYVETPETAPEAVGA